MPRLDPNRLLTSDPQSGPLAQDLYKAVCDLPIVSPHGHTDPAWFANDSAFEDPAALFVSPDHYVTRMLVSHGVPLESLGRAPRDGGPFESDPRKIWKTFAQHYYLFRATPSRMWIDHALEHVFGVEEDLTPDTADAIYDHIADALATPSFRPRALFDRFGVEVLATTDGALDDLRHHAAISASDWAGRVIPTYRPDAVVDPEAEGFHQNLDKLGQITGEDTTTWSGYLAAHRAQRAVFIKHGATASDHGHATPQTADLPSADAAALFDRIRRGHVNAQDAALFRAQMLTEMARLSLEDGLVMQLHPGSMRNHSTRMFRRFGPDIGFDIPKQVDFVEALRPLLEAVGMEPGLTLILFTLDETTYARELAPLAGVYPALKLGPAWWFFDSADGMRRYREMLTETAGFYNTVGFNDDTRAFCSVPARHDVARRVDCAYLAKMVVDGRFNEDEAQDLAFDLTYRLAKKAYRL